MAIELTMPTVEEAKLAVGRQLELLAPIEEENEPTNNSNDCALASETNKFGKMCQTNENCTY